MGWGTEFKANIYLSRIDVNEKTVDDKIEYALEFIESLEKELYMYASCNIKDVVPEEWGDQPIDFIKIKIDDILSELRKEYSKLTDLHHFKEDNCEIKERS